MFFLLIIALLITLIILYCLGFFTNFLIKDSKIPLISLLYIDFKGNYSKIALLQKDFLFDIKKSFEAKGSFILYYDNPDSVMDQRETRAVYGVILNEKEDFNRIKAFCRRFEDIRFVKLKEMPCVMVEIAGLKGFSFGSRVFQRKILTNLVRALQRKRDGEGKGVVDFVGLVEWKDFIKGISIYGIPYGEETNGYYLTRHSEPKHNG